MMHKSYCHHCYHHYWHQDSHRSCSRKNHIHHQNKPSTYHCRHHLPVASNYHKERYHHHHHHHPRQRCHHCHHRRGEWRSEVTQAPYLVDGSNQCRNWISIGHYYWYFLWYRPRMFHTLSGGCLV